jgi:hypothetical protein
VGVITRHYKRYGSSFTLQLAHHRKPVPTYGHKSIAEAARQLNVNHRKLRTGREQGEEFERKIRCQLFKPPPPWHQYTPWAWGYLLHGSMLQYWPGTRKWRWKMQTYIGNVHQFIEDHT